MEGTSGHTRPGRSRVVALSACGYKFREQLSDEYSGFHCSSWQLGAHGGEPDLYPARSGHYSSATALPMALLAWTPSVPATNLPANRDGIPAATPSAAAQRSTGFVISPYTNSGAVVHPMSQKIMKT